MKIAVCCICPDAKQRLHLDFVWPSWVAYAKRHALPLHIIRQPPFPEHFYWGKYFVLEGPELRGYDAALIIDNDVLINPNSPSLLASWDPSRVGLVDERCQFGWSREHVDQYYRLYDLAVPREIANPAILNGGVLVYAREHLPLFHSIFDSWRGWRSAPPKSAPWREVFRNANDQPHVGLALQVAGLAQELDAKFNRIWWSWWMNRRKHSEWPFKIYTKSVKVLTPWLPRAIMAPLAIPGLKAIDQALDENYFLHFAGSKSPLHLLAHRRPEPTT